MLTSLVQDVDPATKVLVWVNTTPVSPAATCVVITRGWPSFPFRRCSGLLGSVAWESVPRELFRAPTPRHQRR